MFATEAQMAARRNPKVDALTGVLRKVGHEVLSPSQTRVYIASVVLFERNKYPATLMENAVLYAVSDCDV
jgi:hypothetical protein